MNSTVIHGVKKSNLRLLPYTGFNLSENFVSMLKVVRTLLATNFFLAYFVFLFFVIYSWIQILNNDKNKEENVSICIVGFLKSKKQSLNL